MKIKNFLFFLIVSLLFLPQAAFAAEFKSGEEVQIKQGETVTENFYSISNSFNQFGKANKDIFSLAKNIEHAGTTSEDHFLTGADVDIEGLIKDDLRAVGNNINISGRVNGESILIGSQVSIDTQAELNQEVTILANKVNIEGVINDNVRVFARNVFIDGNIKDNFQVDAAIFEITENTVIGGDLNYSSDTKAEIPGGAQVSGTVNFSTSTSSVWSFQQQNESIGQTLINKFNRLWWLSLLADLVAGLVLFWLFKDRIKRMTSSAYSNFGRNILIGLAVLIISPVILVGLFTSIFGFWVSILMGLLLGLFLILSKTGGGMLLGSLLRKLILKENRFKLGWNSVAGGIIALSIINVVPFIGSLVETLFSTAAFGVLISYFYYFLSESKDINK